MKGTSYTSTRGSRPFWRHLVHLQSPQRPPFPSDRDPVHFFLLPVPPFVCSIFPAHHPDCPASQCQTIVHWSTFERRQHLHDWPTLPAVARICSSFFHGARLVSPVALLCYLLLLAWSRHSRRGTKCWLTIVYLQGRTNCPPERFSPATKLFSIIHPVASLHTDPPGSFSLAISTRLTPLLFLFPATGKKSLRTELIAPSSTPEPRTHTSPC